MFSYLARQWDIIYINYIAPKYLYHTRYADMDLHRVTIQINPNFKIILVWRTA